MLSNQNAGTDASVHYAAICSCHAICLLFLRILKQTTGANRHTQKANQINLSPSMSIPKTRHGRYPIVFIISSHAQQASHSDRALTNIDAGVQETDKFSTCPSSPLDLSPLAQEFSPSSVSRASSPDEPRRF